ncbi:MGH1-like glycoside hydrolase domain-containing protein [Alsobacter sp. R-9]
MMTPDDLDRLARDILVRNDRGGYTVPNEKVYPFQWNWDSAFVAMGFATYDVDRAWQELETLFLGQWDDGMVPSIVFHRPADNYYPGPPAWGTTHEPPTTGISQPPVAATAARVVLAAEDTPASRRRCAALFPKLFASHRWWHEVRDPDGTGLVTVTHPWETGRDNSPEWDAPLAAVTPTVDVAALRKDKTHVAAAERPTDDFYNRVMTLVQEARALDWDGKAVARTLSLRVCDIGVQSILVRADHDLLWLARTLGFTAEAVQLEAWIDRSTKAFDRLRAPDGTWRSLDLRTGALAPTASSGSFLALYAHVGGREGADRMAAVLDGWASSITYAVPSSDPGAPTYDPCRYWRGPVWLVVNRMICDGFARAGREDVAARIAEQSRALVLRHGLAEYFDPRTGEGLGGRDFTWSAAMWLAWLAGRGSRPLLT